jgi:hypothetical protein
MGIKIQENTTEVKATVYLAKGYNMTVNPFGKVSNAGAWINGDISTE